MSYHLKDFINYSGQTLNHNQTDLENHVAEPHNRCVIVYIGEYKASRDIDDVSERELEFQEDSK